MRRVVDPLDEDEEEFAGLAGISGGREGWVALLAREANLRDFLGCELSFEETVEEVSGFSRRAVKTEANRRMRERSEERSRIILEHFINLTLN